jgi:nucleoside-diphosphate-sugar epimerase
VVEAGAALLKLKNPLVTTQIVKETFGYKYFSSDKARSALGWAPRESLSDAVRAAFMFYKEQGLV